MSYNPSAVLFLRGCLMTCLFFINTFDDAHIMAYSGFHICLLVVLHWTKPSKIAIANQSPCAGWHDLFHCSEIQLVVGFTVSCGANSSTKLGRWEDCCADYGIVVYLGQLQFVSEDIPCKKKKDNCTDEIYKLLTRATLSSAAGKKLT